MLPSLLPLQHVCVVFISHLTQTAFEWEQWALLPWTLFHDSKDKREAWKEETRAGPSQTQQGQRRAIDSHVSSTLSPLRTGKARLAPGWRERRNSAGFTIHKQVPALWSCSGKRQNKLQQAWHLCSLFSAWRLSQGSAVKAGPLKERIKRFKIWFLSLSQHRAMCYQPPKQIWLLNKIAHSSPLLGVASVAPGPGVAFRCCWKTKTLHRVQPSLSVPVDTVCPFTKAMRAYVTVFWHILN